MYISDTPHNPPPKSSMDFSDDDGGGNHQDMMIEMAATSSNPHHTHIQHHHVHSHSTHHHAPKKRAETWVHDETRSLIGLRREMDSMFNTSKSNKHLWEKISARMREKGFDRSPTMCTDKWRNLLKEFKKSKQQHMNNGNGNGNNGNAKMSYYKEIEEILRDRNRCSNPPNSNAAATAYKTPTADASNHALKVDPFMQFSDKGVDDASIQFGPIEANVGSGLNLEESMEHEGHALAITAAEAVDGDGIPPSYWQETPGNGDETHCYSGRVITVKWGDYKRRVGVDGSADAIKDVIRSAFGLRTKRAFWLEDEEQVVRSLDRDMPLGTYTLHLDQGMTIKLCLYNESDHIPYPSQSLAHTVEKTFYTEEDFREFMHRRGWSCLRELDGFREIDNLDDLRPDALYRGVPWDSHGT